MKVLEVNVNIERFGDFASISNPYRNSRSAYDFLNANFDYDVNNQDINAVKINDKFLVSFNFIYKKNMFSTEKKTIYLPILFDKESDAKEILENYDSIMIWLRYRFSYDDATIETYHISKLLDKKFKTYGNKNTMRYVYDKYINDIISKIAIQYRGVNVTLRIKDSDEYSYLNSIFGENDEGIVYKQNLDNYKLYNNTLVNGESTYKLNEYLGYTIRLEDFGKEMLLLMDANILASAGIHGINKYNMVLNFAKLSDAKNTIDKIFEVCGNYIDKVDKLKEKRTYKLVES